MSEINESRKKTLVIFSLQFTCYGISTHESSTLKGQKKKVTTKSCNNVNREIKAQKHRYANVIIMSISFDLLVLVMINNQNKIVELFVFTRKKF